MKLVLQTKGQDDETVVLSCGDDDAQVAITPPIDEAYWAYRVAVSKEQAIIGFPKFTTIGIGFQHETDWNTNLPYTGDAKDIYEHIRVNKGNKRILKARCIEAIRMIQAAARKDRD